MLATQLTKLRSRKRRTSDLHLVAGPSDGEPLDALARAVDLGAARAARLPGLSPAELALEAVVAQIDSFVEMVKVVLPTSSLSASDVALVRQDLRTLSHEARRCAPRMAIHEAVTASVVDLLDGHVSDLSFRGVRARRPSFAIYPVA